ncbi:MAG TPA: FmdE family protein [Azospirillum sp.]|nr:FmdE family protein [Azospirillum sp.]
MRFPAFFDDAPRIRVHDPLSAFLGASDGGMLEYGYADAVKLAGHSCPTLAGAYLMTVKALKHLYGETPPERGGIEVFFREMETTSATGVMARVAALLTGAAGDDGFKGIGGRFDRRNRLFFGAAISGDMALRRLDTQAGVQVHFNGAVVPSAPETRDLLPAVLNGYGTPEDAERFRALWQGRVKGILVDYADDPALVVLTDWA